MSTPAASPPRLERPTAVQVLRSLAGTALAVAVIGLVLPRVTGTTWAQIGAVLGDVGPARVALLLATMLAGLVAYTWTMTASLPGLRAWQALVVNLAGSASSNLLPAGGAIGVAVTYLMGRSWGLSAAAITTSVAVTTVWNVLARVVLPLLGMLALLASGSRESLPSGVVDGAVAGAVTAALVTAAFVAFLVSDDAARALARLAGRVVRRDLVPAVLDQKARWREVVARGWVGMTLGLVGYFGWWFVLFVLCLHTAGAQLPLAEAFAAYAVGRLLTAVGITPGGLGVTEAGTAAVLVAFGVGAAQASAAVVLVALCTHVAEIAFGLLAWAVWVIGPRERGLTSSSRRAGA